MRGVDARSKARARQRRRDSTNLTHSPARPVFYFMSRTINLHEAEIPLSALVDAAEHGEEVIRLFEGEA